MKILVTGGCGYVGSALVPALLKNNYKVVVVDTQWFGINLKKHKNLKIIKLDIRNIEKFSLKGFNKIIHLAGIANDPSADLNQSLSWEINVLATHKLLNHAIKYRVKHFIFASSGSVYGVKKEKNVTENLSLLPISTYNKTKMIAESILFNAKDKIRIHCVRPATVCGLATRTRFDVSVNMLALQGIKNNFIKVFGGKQIRPNIHIKDLVSVYLHFVKKKGLKNGAYNAGFENISILEIAKRIKKITNTPIKVTFSNDPRSYKVSSEKLLKTGFKPKYNVNFAINEIIKYYKKRKIKNSSYTVKYMKKKGLDKII